MNSMLVFIYVHVFICVCVCVSQRESKKKKKKVEQHQGQKKEWLLTGNPKLFHWRERESKMKKYILWDLHVYVVCGCRKYLGIVAAE